LETLRRERVQLPSLVILELSPAGKKTLILQQIRKEDAVKE